MKKSVPEWCKELTQDCSEWYVEAKNLRACRGCEFQKNSWREWNR